MKSIVKSLQTWWKSTDSMDEPRDYDNSPEPAVKAEAVRERKLLCRFILEEFSFLGDEMAEKLSQRVHHCHLEASDGYLIDLANVLRDALPGNPFTNSPKPYAFVFDAQYVEDTEKVISAIWAVYGGIDRFTYDEKTESAIPSRMFISLRKWLHERNHDFILIDSGGDEYLGIFCPLPRINTMLKHAASIGISCTTQIPSDE